METISSEKIMSTLREELAQINATVDRQEASVVTEVADGIARISGLKTAMAGELLKLTSSATGLDVYGLVQNLDQDDVGAVLFGDAEEIKEGDECRTTGRVMDIPVGHAMLGRVVNPLGQPIDGLGPINTTHRRPIEFKAPGIMDRQPVCEPVQTGLLAIDAMVPIGRGQRELIIGDRKTGKTAIAIDAIVNQRATDMICIYVAIGQKASTVAGIRESLAQHGVLDKTVIVSATAAESAPMQYIAPMAGAAIGEYFMYNDEHGNPADAEHPGGHVLVVYDDLSKQAVAYRQMSLTLHRPPGREAYPGDIFYLHSRLLERACKLSDANGGGSLTALPIIETQEGDVSAYIPTNVISITDGQIYLQSNLFFQGQRPAVDVGISVSRVGGDAQIKAMKQVVGTLRLDLAAFREKQAFSQFGSDLDATTQYQLNHGAHVMEMLKQQRFSALDVPRPGHLDLCRQGGLPRRHRPRERDAVPRRPGQVHVRALPQAARLGHGRQDRRRHGLASARPHRPLQEAVPRRAPQPQASRGRRAGGGGHRRRAARGRSRAAGRPGEVDHGQPS